MCILPKILHNHTYLYTYILTHSYASVYIDKSVVTVWSAPNYCYRCGNVASILSLDDHLNREFKLFNDVPDSDDSVEVQRRNLIPYFL